LACSLFVQGGSDATSNTNSAFADLHIFGKAVEVIPRCPACGGPPWTFDMDVDVPADMTPGMKTFPIWATDSLGHTAANTASIEIVSR